MSFKNMTVGMKLKILMVFLVITLIVSSILSFTTTYKLNNQIEDLANVQMPGSRHMDIADMMHDGIRANVYSAIVNSHSQNEEDKKVIKEEGKEFANNIRKHINGLQTLKLRPETKLAIAPAIPRVEEYVKIAKEIVDVALSGEEEKAREMLPAFDEKFGALEKELGKLGDLIEQDGVRSSSYSEIIEKESRIYNLISLLFASLLIIFFYFVIHDLQKGLALIIDDLIKESGMINDIASNINTSAGDLSSATQEQSAAYQQSAAALEQISATIKTTDTNSRQLDYSSKSSFDSATNGKVTIEEMLKAMEDIQISNSLMAKQTEESNKRISEIANVISEIENKTKVINDIVFQTKLLSFNASVEAARAGDQGKGFAVVAQEVGNLAAVSGNAARDISQLLTNSIQTVHLIVNESKTKAERITIEGHSNVEQGIAIANKCGNALEEIVTQTETVGELISEITTAVNEQAKGISEVSNAMSLLDQASIKNSHTSNENWKNAQSLKEQVTRLEGVVNRLSRY